MLFCTGHFGQGHPEPKNDISKGSVANISLLIETRSTKLVPFKNPVLKKEHHPIKVIWIVYKWGVTNVFTTERDTNRKKV